jgi:cobalt-zinc-cadmium efflux system outer membrane protein
LFNSHYRPHWRFDAHREINNMWISIYRFASRCALLSILYLPAYAISDSTETTAPRAITLDEAISKTLGQNPGLRAYGFQLDIKRGRLQQAGLAPNPELIVRVEDAMGTGEYQGFSNAETTISLGWVFERTLREHRISAAQASESVTVVDIEILRVDTAAETARRFLAVMANQARTQTAINAVELAEMTVKAAQRRVEVGLSPNADLARAQAELSYARLAVDDFEHELKTSRHLLAAQWGLNTPDFDRVQGDPFILPDAIPFQILQQQAEQNPEITRYLARQRLDEAELQLAKAERKPGWKGTFGMRRYENVNDVAFVTGFTVPLTLRNRNQGKITEALAVADQTLAETVAARVEIETTLYVFYEALQHSLHRANTLRNDVLPQIELALTETKSAYERGRYSYFDWRTVQAEMIEVQNKLIDASIDAHLNVIEMERLTGIRIAQAGSTP